MTLEEEGQTPSAEATSGADGAFSFSSQRPGTYVVRVRLRGFRELVTPPMKLAPGQIANLKLTLGAKDESGQDAAPKQGSNTATGIEFSDKPDFTVAGITDWSNTGLHGSDVNAKTSASLSKEAAALKSSGNATSASGDARETGSNGAAAKAGEADAHREAGDGYEKAGDPVAAEHEYEAAVRIDPSEPNYFSWGTELLLHKAIQPAVEVFGKGAVAHPDSARMLVGLGAALYAAGSYEDAARRVCQASDFKPQDATPYLFLGKMQKSVAGALPCVEERLQRFVGEQPGNALAYYYYALALWKRGRGQDSVALQEQETLLQKAVNLDARFAEGHLQLGIVYFAQDRSERAIAAYSKAAELDPDLAEAHYRLALAYKRTGEKAKAEQEFQAYKRIQKTEAEAAERERKELQQFVVILKGQEQKAEPK